jgi:glucokinase
MPVKKPYIGVDLGGTNMQVGVVSPDLKLLAPAKRKTKADEGLDAIVTRMVSAIEEACAGAGIEVAQLGGIGVGAPGAVDPHDGIVLEAVNLRWNDVPLAQILSKKLKVDAFLDNDVNAAVYGENKLGAGKNSKHLLGVWVGTGIGGGLILNGALYYGHFMTAGEIGHTILFPNHPAGARSLEHNTSRTAVVDRIVRLIRSNRKSKIMSEVDGDVEKIKSRTLAKAYESGDDLTIEVVDDSAELLGTSIAGVVTLLSLERVVLGGGLVEAIGKPYVDRVQKTVRRLAFPDACKKVDVVASQLEDNAGVFGAAMIAMDRTG